MSKNDPSRIYVRLSMGRGHYAQTTTKLYINPDHLDRKQGRAIKQRMPSKASAEEKTRINAINANLAYIDGELQRISSLIYSEAQKVELEEISKAWLEDLIDPQEEVTTLSGAFELYLNDPRKKKSVKASTRKQMRSHLARLEKFEQGPKIDGNERTKRTNGIVLLSGVNDRFVTDLLNWLEYEGYAYNTGVKMIKQVRTVCGHADRAGVKVNQDYKHITQGLKNEKTVHTYLTLDELRRIERAEMPSKTLEIARDWLLISCDTGQRVSDFMKFNKRDIKQTEAGAYLSIKQQKTGKPVSIPLSDRVLAIVRHYKGFPPQFSSNRGSNDTIYNRHIKKVCMHAGITDRVESKLRQAETNRYQTRTRPKWQSVSSHIGRRSFATNFYGILHLSILKDITGHSSERQFLAYVGEKEPDNLDNLITKYREAMSAVNLNAKMSVVSEN